LKVSQLTNRAQRHIQVVLDALDESLEPSGSLQNALASLLLCYMAIIHVHD
jgi:hypothetical protein